MARTTPRPHPARAASAARTARGLGAALALCMAMGAACRQPAPAAGDQVAPPTAAPTVKPPPGSRPSAVLLRQRKGRLVALACYDAAAQALRAGDACAALLPDQTEVRLGDAHTSRVRRAPPLICQTDKGPVSHPSYALLDGPPADASPTPSLPLALWAAGPLPKLELPPVPPEPIPLPPSERQAIRRAASLLLPPPQRLLLGDVTIDSVWVVDLDADGLRERLDQVRLFDVRGRFAMLTGVFVVAGQDAVALRPLRVQIVPPAERERLGADDHSYDTTMFAAVDLDHDSRREVWLQLGHGGLTEDTVGRFLDGGLTTFAAMTCDDPASGPPLPAPSRPAVAGG